MAMRLAGGGTGAAGVGAAGAVDGGFIRPALVSDAIRSLPNCGVAVATGWVWTLCSCAWVAFSRDGTASRICGVLGFCEFWNSAASELNCCGLNVGMGGGCCGKESGAEGGCENGAGG